MAFLYITELNAIGGTGNHPVQGCQMPPLTEQVIAIGGASTPSATLNPNTSLVRLHCDIACSIVFGPSTPTPVATTSNARMAANQTEYFNMPSSASGGQALKIAVIAN